MPSTGKTVFSHFLNLLFPPLCPLCRGAVEQCGLCQSCLPALKRIDGCVCTFCGKPFPSATGSGHACADCLRKKPPFTRMRSAYYYEGRLLEAIHRFKYGGDMALLKPLGLLLLDGVKVLGEMPDAIVPVPLHRKRLKERGFNQSLLLARELSRELSIGVDYLNLKRTRHTPPQINLKAKERRQNVRGAFEAVNPSRLRGRRILLVDDVFTTGATVRECAKALKKAGAEVFVATLARVGHM